MAVAAAAGESERALLLIQVFDVHLKFRRERIHGHVRFSIGRGVCECVLFLFLLLRRDKSDSSLDSFLFPPIAKGKQEKE